jgi:hypothetical protein
MDRAVATEPGGEYHFELGRFLAERLGYPAQVLDRIPAGAIESSRASATSSIWPSSAPTKGAGLPSPGNAAQSNLGRPGPPLPVLSRAASWELQAGSRQDVSMRFAGTSVELAGLEPAASWVRSRRSPN